MLIVPYLMLADHSCKQGPAIESSDVNAIHRYLEYSMDQQLRVSISRVKDHNQVEIYRILFERVYLESEKPDNVTSLQLDCYQYSNELIRSQFYQPDITEPELLEGFPLPKLDQSPSRFTRVSLFRSPIAGKSQLEGVFRIIGQYPTSFLPMIDFFIALGQEGAVVSLFRNYVEFQSAQLGTTTLCLERGDVAEKQDIEVFWKQLDQYVQSDSPFPRSLRTVQ